MPYVNYAKFDKEDLERLSRGVKTWLRDNTCDNQIDEAMGLLSKIAQQKRRIEAKATQPAEQE